jgi:hypothetical protein
VTKLAKTAMFIYIEDYERMLSVGELGSSREDVALPI